MNPSERCVQVALEHGGRAALRAPTQALSQRVHAGLTAERRELRAAPSFALGGEAVEARLGRQRHRLRVYAQHRKPVRLVGELDAQVTAADAVKSSSGAPAAPRPLLPPIEPHGVTLLKLSIAW